MTGERPCVLLSQLLLFGPTGDPGTIPWFPISKSALKPLLVRARPGEVEVKEQSIGFVAWQFASE